MTVETFGLDRRPWMLPMAVMSVVPVVATLAGSGFALLPFYTAGPALAAARGSTATVLGTGIVSVGLCLGGALMDGLLGHTRLLIALGGIIVVTGAACYVSAVRHPRPHRRVLPRPGRGHPRPP